MAVKSTKKKSPTKAVAKVARATDKGAAVPRLHVRLTCDEPALSVVALLGDGPVQISGGFGGWEVTARPRQVGMTTWQGVEPFQVSLPLMLDGWTAGKSQHPTLRKLYAVARGDKDSDPGILEVAGVPLPADRWVIEGIEFGDVIVRPDDGHPLRQALTLTLREYVPPAYLRLRKGALQGGRGKTAVVKAKKGDTPAKMAKRYRTSFNEIRRLNTSVITKVNQLLDTGIRIRVPVAEKRDKDKKKSKSKGGR